MRKVILTLGILWGTLSVGAWQTLPQDTLWAYGRTDVPGNHRELGLLENFRTLKDDLQDISALAEAFFYDLAEGVLSKEVFVPELRELLWMYVQGWLGSLDSPVQILFGTMYRREQVLWVPLMVVTKGSSLRGELLYQYQDGRWYLSGLMDLSPLKKHTQEESP